MAKDRAPTYYLDANVFVDLIETPAGQEPGKTIAAAIEDAEKGRIRLVTSILTIAEVWYAKAEIDEKAPDPDVEKKISGFWHPDSSPIWLVDVHELIVREAAKLLRQGIQHGWCKTKGVDGIHLTTAKREGVQEFWTSEKAAKKWEPIVGYRICPPHREPEENQLDFGAQPPEGGQV